MKKISVYQTSDGKTFNAKGEATLHEAKIEARNFILAEYDAIFKAAPETKRLLIPLIEEPQFFIDALSKVAKLQKQQTKASEAAPTMKLAA